MLTALMQQAQGPPGAGIPMVGGYGPPPPGAYGQPGPGMVPVNGFGAPPPPGYPPPLPPYGHGQVHGHGRHSSDRGERGGGPKPPLHASLPVRPAGLPPKPSAPLGAGGGGGRHERERERDRERGREREPERGRERERGRGGGSTTGGVPGNEGESGGLSGGLPYS